MPDAFYRDLSPIGDFQSVADVTAYREVPASWYVAMTDIEGSTAAVEAGHYRTVNFIGAISIAAVLNALPEEEVPFVFGGDGATLLVPPGAVPSVREVLRGVQAASAETFGLTLRAGLVPVERVYEAGHRLLLGRFQAAPDYAQAVFMGHGLTYAEDLLKDPEAGAAYRLTPSVSTEPADFTGIECRWNRIASPHGETVTLLVQAQPDAAPDADASRVYRDVLAQIEAIYGRSPAWHPIDPVHLRPSFSPTHLGALEPGVRATQAGLPRWLYTLKMWAQNVLLKLFWTFDLTTGTTHWRSYRGQIQATSDYRKFDGTLRMVIAGTTSQRSLLEHYLEEGRREGRLAYGLHVTDSATMTCLVYERMGRQVHFVDGTGGGYTQAARALKAQLGAG